MFLDTLKMATNIIMKENLSQKIPLPVVNPAENLETISRNRLSLLFDPALFEVRQELQRDKGIDLIVELKQDNTYTNFRFVIQLKSTTSAKVNKDQAISYPVDVTNINYLLNYTIFYMTKQMLIST